MKQQYLEVTFRKGKPLAAYLYLHPNAGDKCVRTEKREAGLIVDYAPDGRAIGIEITAPGMVALTSLNRVMESLNESPLTQEDVSPLVAA
jgi:uncharacterized protein YuzE